MAEKVTNEEPNLTIGQIFQELRKNGNFDISVCDSITNIDDNPKFKKLELTSGQKMQMSALVSQLPSIMATSMLANAYVVKFPLGAPYTLMKLNQGGYGSPIMGKNGIVGHASFFQATTQAAVLSVFNAMSVASGQYFLAQINSELDRINLGIDKILGFLYGDKKAELMSEVNFVKYAYQNYSAIMANESQRIATISSLQQAKKIAIKDSEFYISDLEATVKSDSDIISTVDNAFNIEKSLELSLQLCVMSSIMEVYYAQNFDKDYLKYIDDDISLYIDKCGKCILKDFSILQSNVQKFKGNPLKKIDKAVLEQKVSEVVDKFNVGGESELTESLHSGLYLSEKQSEYYFDKDGNVYIKTV